MAVPKAPAELLDDAGDGGGLGHLILAQIDVGDGQHGDEDDTQAETPNEQRYAEDPEVGVHAAEGEGHGRAGDDETPGDGDEPGAEPLDQISDDEPRQQGADALGDE